MRRVLTTLAAGALMAGGLAAGAAQAAEGQARSADKAAKPATARVLAGQKVLYICSEDERSWRAFSRDLGTPDFVTAEQVRAEAGKAWNGPRCITEGEAKRLNIATLAPR